ncbi:MAG: alpha/beta hydrolase [Ruminococcus sp.]|nr:alpha/beta hydrolase [Ruminococcus sp.]
MSSIKNSEFLANASDIFATKEDLKNSKARFTLIGHSNGGLVSRYYIENLGGDVNVDKLITVGYTYDWADNGTEYGMTEFILKSGTDVAVDFTETTSEFLNRITKNS